MTTPHVSASQHDEEGQRPGWRRQGNQDEGPDRTSLEDLLLEVRTHLHTLTCTLYSCNHVIVWIVWAGVNWEEPPSNSYIVFFHELFPVQQRKLGARTVAPMFQPAENCHPCWGVLVGLGILQKLRWRSKRRICYLSDYSTFISWPVSSHYWPQSQWWRSGAWSHWPT